MCINKELSLSALIISWSVGFYLLYRNEDTDRWNAIFIMTFSLMQLIDFILWLLYDIGNFNHPANYYISKYIVSFVLVSELIAVYLGSQLYKNGNKYSGFWNRVKLDFINSSYPKILLCVVIWMLWFNIKYNNKTVIGNDGGLVWGDNINKKGILKYVCGIIFIIFLLYPYLEYIWVNPVITIIIIYLVITLSYSFIIGSHWGSYWCWIANFLSIIVLLTPVILKYV